MQALDKRPEFAACPREVLNLLKGAPDTEETSGKLYGVLQRYMREEVITTRDLKSYIIPTFSAARALKINGWRVFDAFLDESEPLGMWNKNYRRMLVQELLESELADHLFETLTDYPVDGHEQTGPTLKRFARALVGQSVDPPASALALTAEICAIYNRVRMGRAEAEGRVLGNPFSKNHGELVSHVLGESINEFVLEFGTSVVRSIVDQIPVGTLLSRAKDVYDYLKNVKKLYERLEAGDSATSEFSYKDPSGAPQEVRCFVAVHRDIARLHLMVTNENRKLGVFADLPIAVSSGVDPETRRLSNVAFRDHGTTAETMRQAQIYFSGFQRQYDSIPRLTRNDFADATPVVVFG